MHLVDLNAISVVHESQLGHRAELVESDQGVVRAFETANPPGSKLYDVLTIFLSTAASGGIDHVVNDTGGSSTAANPDTPVDVISYP